MNKTLEAIFNRYSCRDFLDTPLTHKQVTPLIEAALAAPSAMNRQPWHIIAITDKSIIDELDCLGMELLRQDFDQSLYERIVSRGGKMFYNAPCMIIVASDASNYSALDCGIVSQNVALCAHALGLGSVICGMAGILFSSSNSELKLRLKFPLGYDFKIAILVGNKNSVNKPHELDYKKVTYITGDSQ